MTILHRGEKELFDVEDFKKYVNEDYIVEKINEDIFDEDLNLDMYSINDQEYNNTLSDESVDEEINQGKDMAEFYNLFDNIKE